jgi:hypothetical protein
MRKNHNCVSVLTKKRQQTTSCSLRKIINYVLVSSTNWKTSVYELNNINSHELLLPIFSWIFRSSRSLTWSYISWPVFSTTTYQKLYEIIKVNVQVWNCMEIAWARIIFKDTCSVRYVSSFCFCISFCIVEEIYI